jgi:hypothetical protein
MKLILSFALVLAGAAAGNAQQSCAGCDSSFGSCTQSVQSSFNSCSSSASRSRSWSDLRCSSDFRSCVNSCDDRADPQLKAQCLVGCDYDAYYCFRDSENEYNRAMNDCNSEANRGANDCSAARQSCLTGCTGMQMASAASCKRPRPVLIAYALESSPLSAERLVNDLF